MKKLILIALFLSAWAGFAQAQSVQNGGIRKVTALPSSCTTNVSDPVRYQGKVYQCISGAYAVTLTLGNGGAAGTSTRVKAKDNGLVGNSSTDDRAALNTLVNTTMQSNGGILFFAAGTYVIGSSVSIPANVVLEFDPGAKLGISSSATVTIAGSIIASSTRQAFACAGTGAVSFTSLGEISPHWFGAKGDAVTDDTIPIQKAVDAIAGLGNVQFEQGSYLITSSININRGLLFTGRGSRSGGSFRGTVIAGSVNGPILNCTLAGIWSGLQVSQMQIVNSHATGTGILVENVGSPMAITHCLVNAYRGITFVQNTFTVRVESVNCTGSGFGANGWGIAVAGHATLINCDITGYEDGIRVFGFGIQIISGRYEVNKTAIVIGKDLNGNSIGVSGIAISGTTFEANDTAIYAQSGGGMTFSDIYVQGTSNAPAGQSIYAIRSTIQGTGAFRNISINGGYTKAAFAATGGQIFENVTVGSNAFGVRWDIARPNISTFISADYDPSPTVPVTNFIASQFVSSIGAKDEIRGTYPGKNLRGIDLAVGAGVSFLDVAFPSFSAGNAAINATSTTADGTSTLPTGTYYYIASIVNEIGETAATSERTVTVATGERVDITFFGTSANQKQWRRRVYRGTTSGVYAGYFELPIESSTTFGDKGQSFTITGRQPRTSDAAIGTEPNANYAIAVSPGWSTAYYISNKSTSGFRINFASAPGSNSTLDWILIR